MFDENLEMNERERVMRSGVWWGEGVFVCVCIYREERVAKLRLLKGLGNDERHRKILS